MPENVDILLFVHSDLLPEWSKEIGIDIRLKVHSKKQVCFCVNP